MSEFFKTRMGKQFYEVQVPRIADALERIAKSIEEQNKLAKMTLGIENEEDEQDQF